MKKRQYYVGGHTFSVEAEDDIFSDMYGYEPFRIDNENKDVVFTVTITHSAEKANIYFHKENEWEMNDLSSISGYTPNGEFVFKYFWHHELIAVLISNKHFTHGDIYLTGYQRFVAINTTMMILYRHSTAHLLTTIIHASAVCYNQQAYLFIGLSGTGKSTHSKLWMKYFSGVEMINDDKPVIRVENDRLFLYGTPWSGKLNCFKNVCFPVGAIVKLKQAPYNKIRQLNKIESYVTLLHCIYGKRWNKPIGDALHEIETKIISLSNVWELECLPDQEAANICKETITKNIII